MSIKSTMAPHSTAPEALATLVRSWRRSLAARRVSPRTIATYAISVEQLAAFLEAQGMPTAVASIRREHVESFIGDLLARKAPATAHDRFRGCQAFFAWVLEEGEIRESPMVTRYVASTRQERALTAARALSPLDRLEEPKR